MRRGARWDEVLAMEPVQDCLPDDAGIHQLRQANNQGPEDQPGGRCHDPDGEGGGELD